MSAKEKECGLLAPVAAARAEERTIKVELTEGEFRFVREGLNHVLRHHYGNLGEVNPYLSRGYAAKVFDECDQVWNLLERLNKAGGVQTREELAAELDMLKGDEQ